METNINQKVSCVANYSYDASEPDELTLRPGEVLRDVERLSGGWWRGELRGRRGMFPDNFVSVVAEHVPLRSNDIQGRCRAVFSYQPANPDELPLCVGDVLEVLSEVEEGWWQGRRQGRVGVFPSNFVVMLDPPSGDAPPAYDPAPALPPKPVKELCCVLYPYTAVNEDELTLAEGEIVTIVSKDAPDRGWWRGEINGRSGLFPDNFVQLLPAGAVVAEEKKPDRPPSKNIYPVLKFSEKISSIKELSTAKSSLHKESTLNKESNIQKDSTITHTNKSDTEKVVHSETINDGSLDSQVKKPPVPLKKSPTPTPGVGGLFSGLKGKMLSTDKEKTSTVSSSTSSSSGEWDKTDGAVSSKAGPNTGTNFDHVERNSMLNDPRASRVKAPRRRPPSQTLRDEPVPVAGLSNGHESEKPASEKAEEIKPKAREWEKHRAPWMAELKLNQAKKTNVADIVGSVLGKGRSGSEDAGVTSKAGSTDRILDCGLDEKKSTHSMEMSKSTSSISSRISVLESFEETKVRHSMDSKKEGRSSKESDPVAMRASLHSPTAAGRTFTTLLDDIKKPTAPTPPSASVRTTTDLNTDKNAKYTAITSETTTETTTTVRPNSGVAQSAERAINKPSALYEKVNVLSESATVAADEKPIDKPVLSNTLERRLQSMKVYEKNDGTEALINQLNNRILNLEKLLEVQNAKFTAIIEELKTKLVLESEKRQALQTEVEKLAHCVTQV